jgi:hypothetical protein
MTGNFSEALLFMNRGTELLEPHNPQRFGIYATGIEIALATSDEPLGEATLLDGVRLRHALPQEHSYYELFFELQRVRWLIYRRRYSDAIDAANSSLGPIEKLADSTLFERMKLLAAEASHLALNHVAAADAFATVSSSISDLGLETLAEVHRVAAVLTGNSNQHATHYYLGTAWRILTEPP